MKESEFTVFLRKKWGYTFTDNKTNQKIIRYGSNKKGHGLSLVNGHLYCNLCDTPVGRKFGQHLGGKNHWAWFEAKMEEELKRKQKNVVTAEVNENETQKEAFSRMTEEVLIELQIEQEKDQLSGSSLSRRITEYRLGVLEHAYLANMPLSQLERFKGALDLKGPSAISIGCARDLPRLFGSALHKAQMKKMKWIMNGCYPLFATVSDGSPLGANAEVIIVRMIRVSDHRILEILISLKLFKGKLTGQNIASNLLSELSRYDLDLQHWRGSIMDRASTNSKAINEIKRVSFHEPGFFPCFSHVFSGPGKEFKKKCKELHNFRKAYNTSIMFRGKLYNEIKRLACGVPPVIAGGVRWYLEWEQIKQIDEIGLERFVDEIIPFALERKLSEKSVLQMRRCATPEIVPKLIVQAAAVSAVGKEFCLATYLTTEGNDPLALGMYRIFDRIDTYVAIGADFEKNSRVEKRCRDAADLVMRLREDILDNLSTASIEVDNINNEITAIGRQIESAELELEGLNQREEQRRVRRTNRQRARAIDYNAYAGNRTTTPQSIEQRIAKLREDKDNLDQQLDAANDLKSTYEDELERLDEKLGPITADDFVEYAKEVTKIAFEKYTALFDDGELKRVRRAFCGCEVFDVLLLREHTSIHSLHRMIDDLKFFEFPEFDDDFLTGMKNELVELIDLAMTMEFNFEDEPDNSEIYTNRVLSRARRTRQREILKLIDNVVRQARNGGEAALPIRIEDEIQAAANEIGEIRRGDYRKMEWKNDPGERARRIYEWWRVVMNEKIGHLPYFTKAVRIVCLLQPSSASAERVFSQLTFIRRMIGDQVLEDTLECRAFIRCNNGFKENYNS